VRAEHVGVGIADVQLHVGAVRVLDARGLAGQERMLEQPVDPCVHVAQQDPPADRIPIQGEHVTHEVREVDVGPLAGQRVPHDGSGVTAALRVREQPWIAGDAAESDAPDRPHRTVDQRGDHLRRLDVDHRDREAPRPRVVVGGLDGGKPAVRGQDPVPGLVRGPEERPQLARADAAARVARGIRPLLQRDHPGVKPSASTVVSASCAPSGWTSIPRRT
jgi:hypothetical protein